MVLQVLDSWTGPIAGGCVRSIRVTVLEKKMFWRQKVTVMVLQRCYSTSQLDKSNRWRLCAVEVANAVNP
jgi:hypothetical protein